MEGQEGDRHEGEKGWDGKGREGKGGGDYVLTGQPSNDIFHSHQPASIPCCSYSIMGNTQRTCLAPPQSRPLTHPSTWETVMPHFLASSSLASSLGYGLLRCE